MADSKVRAQVRRLLSGTFRPDDLANLFLFARDHSDGREAVGEIGDFAAHQGKRTKGLISRETRDWFAIARFHQARFGPGGPYPLRADNLPAVTPEYLKASLRRIDNKALAKHARMSRTEANRLLPFILRTLTRKPSGSFSLGNIYTLKERSLLKTLLSLMVVRNAFDGKRLFSEFTAVLRSNGLASKAEMASAPNLRPLIELFALSLMHNCLIQFADGTTTTLYVTRGSTLEVCSAVPVDAARNTYLSAAVFSTNLDPSEHCTERLLALHNWRAIELELSPNGRLDLL